jgi:hypothetical protein
LRVNEDGEITVSAAQHPPFHEGHIMRPFTQWFTADGLESGSNDMIVDGSSAPQEFYIEARKDVDLYIKTISMNIGDGGSPALNKFGELSALSNGLSWTHETQDFGSTVLADGLKTNLSCIRIGNETQAIGTGNNAYLADTSGGGTEKNYLPLIDVSELFFSNTSWGLRLRKGTRDRLVFTVNDAMAGLITFNIFAAGSKI